LLETSLAILAHLGQPNVPTVAEQLIGIEPGQDVG
jgi:hypothetical protein